jgi:type II secretory ATPase GspE/PulE/Tfp pilus assembly ATPase PilB-like protein
VPIHELLVASEHIKALVQSKAHTSSILRAALQEGMVTLLQDGIQKVMRGLTTYRQVRAVAVK